MKHGFTIFELVIGLGIMSVLIAAFVAFFGRTLDTANSFDVNNELLAEGQIAQQLATGRLQEGWHVFPSGKTYTITGWQFTNPTTGANSWTIGTDPMLALALPPTNLTTTCSSTTLDACYRFFAIYGIKRSVYVTNTASNLSNRLLNDPQNPNAWVLMQIECTMAAGDVNVGSPSVTAPNSTITVSNCKSNLLADYMTPIVSNSYTPFQRISDSQVRLDLRFSRNAKGRIFSVGGTNSSLNTVVLLRNQGISAPAQGVE